MASTEQTRKRFKFTLDLECNSLDDVADVLQDLAVEACRYQLSPRSISSRGYVAELTDRGE